VEKAIVLLSGGLDSVTLAHYVADVNNEEVCGLFFHYGQEFEQPEEDYAIRCIQNLRKKGHNAFLDHLNIDPQDLYADSESYNPARNLIFLSYATRYAEMNGIKKIYVGLISSEGCPINFPDATKKFVRDYDALINGMYGMELEAPFIDKSKQEVYAQAKWLGVKLSDTWSCNFPDMSSGKAEECGICANCLLREEFAKSDSFAEKVKRLF